MRNLFGVSSFLRPGLLAVGVAALLTAGCSDSQPETTVGSSLTTPPTEAVDFDPCTDIPQDVLKSEGLVLTGPEDWERNGIKAHGCGYVVIESGYDVRVVRTTNTLADIKAKFAESYREQLFGSRTGAFYALFENPESCTVNLEMKTGSLQFDLRNPATRRTTGHLNSCDLVTDLINKVLPSIPTGA